MKEIKEKLYSRISINKETECWEWLGAKNPGGYGCIMYNKKKYGTHRLSWIISNGEIESSDIMVCHKCDNRRCINPSHLFLGTAYDNAMDAINKGRMKVPEKNRFEIGHIPNNCKISKEKAKEISEIINNRRNNNEKLNLKILAQEYNISYDSIRDISCNKTFKNMNL